MCKLSPSCAISPTTIHCSPSTALSGALWKAVAVRSVPVEAVPNRLPTECADPVGGLKRKKVIINMYQCDPLVPYLSGWPCALVNLGV